MRIELDTIDRFPDFKAMTESYPEIKARILGYIGKQAAMQLYEEHLQGQDITYHDVTRSASGNPKSRKNRRLVTYSIDRGLKWAAVSSFPLNLYENRKHLRKGDAARKGILRRKLSSGLAGRLGKYINDAENLIIDDWFNGNIRKIQ